VSRNYELLSALEQAENPGGDGAGLNFGAAPNHAGNEAGFTSAAQYGQERGRAAELPKRERGQREAVDGKLARRKRLKEKVEQAESDAFIYSELSHLVQHVFLGALESRRTVIFCGVDRESAAISSWICTQAAELLAGRVPGFVCIVDSNLESLSGKPSEVEKSAFDIGGGGGAANFPGTLLRVRGNLWLSSDKAPAGERNGMAARIEQLRKTFEYVLVDAPAVSGNSETPIFGRAADGVVMVLEAFSTRREAALKAKERIQASGGKLIGIVLNDRRFPIPEKLYRRL